MVLLAELHKLQRLSVEWTRVTDAGLARISRLPELQHLHLCGTLVTDLGIEHLKSLPSLTCLYIGYNRRSTTVAPLGSRSSGGFNCSNYTRQA